MMLTMQQQVPDRAASPSDDLPPGWEVRFTDAGEVYYVEYAATRAALGEGLALLTWAACMEVFRHGSHNTRTTTWKHPRHGAPGRLAVRTANTWRAPGELG